VSLIGLVVTLIVVGILLWLVNSLIPMEARIKQILNAVVIIAVVLWLLGVFFGGTGRLSSIKVPTYGNGCSIGMVGMPRPIALDCGSSCASKCRSARGKAHEDCMVPCLQDCQRNDPPPVPKVPPPTPVGTGGKTSK
jgi:hypothetical protein